MIETTASRNDVVARVTRLSADQRDGFRALLLELRRDAEIRADECWRR